jgi:hypothetical protein
MDIGTVVGIGVFLVITGWIYNAGHKTGKREGSRKGYGVGLDRGRRTRGQAGCLTIFLVFGLLLAITAVALAYAK